MIVALGELGAGTPISFSSPPASSSIISTPTIRQLMIAPGAMARVLATMHVAGIAVVRQRVGDEAVVPRIAHRRVEEPVDHQRAGRLVHLVLDRLAPDRHLDHDIHLVGRIVSDGNGVEAHGGSPDKLLCAALALG